MSTTARARRPAKTTAAASAPAAPKLAVKAKPKTAVPQVPARAPVKAEAKPPEKAKPVLIRDGFTMPEADFALIAALKKRAATSGRESKKSELLRAGLRALAALDAKALVAALGALEPVKIGRPRKGH